MNKFKLGKKSARLDPRTFLLSDYLHALPPVPEAIDWGGKVADWEMLGNDTVGDCTCAAAGHLEMLFTSQAGGEFAPTVTQILAAYSAITGYNPNDPASDQGADELSVLNYWRKHGIAGRKIYSYVKVDVKNPDEVRAAIALFGNLYIGVQLPKSAMDDFNEGVPWSNVHDDNIEGGHALPLVAYDAATLTCVTWGREQKMTWQWFAKSADEAYVVLSPDWIGGGGLAPSGFKLSELQADLKAL